MSKEKIFALLSAQAGDFVSGEDISAQLGISRAAVWKAVGALRRDGYTIEAQTGLCYRLADSRWRPAMRWSAPAACGRRLSGRTILS